MQLGGYPGYFATPTLCFANIQAQTMDEVKLYLESSTIHGLNNIATSKKNVRLFWIIVVISGFTGASVMICQSAKTWEETPVKTTIETLPISEITLPKVTVCPPENTFTNLNYDLMRIENITLDNEARKNLTNYASDLLLEHLNDTVLKDLSVLQDKDRYYNWYYGNSEVAILNPDYDYDHVDMTTGAKSGNVSTQHFGESFDPDKVELNMNLAIVIISPKV